MCPKNFLGEVYTYVEHMYALMYTYYKIKTCNYLLQVFLEWFLA